jgi:hypothetical protein
MSDMMTYFFCVVTYRDIRGMWPILLILPVALSLASLAESIMYE